MKTIKQRLDEIIDYAAANDLKVDKITISSDLRESLEKVLLKDFKTDSTFLLHEYRGHYLQDHCQPNGWGVSLSPAIK